jgi:2-iminobutanoate/2-iminopropanoate deaminase
MPLGVFSGEAAMRSRALALLLVLGLPALLAAAPPPERFLYLPGTGPTDASGRVVAGDIREQTARVLDNVAARLAAQGSRLERAAAVTVYLRRLADFAAMNEVYARYWPKDPPARTTIVIDLVEPDALVEMSLVALPATADRRVVLPAGWVKPSSPYSYAIQSGDTLFLSGLLSRNGRDNSVVPGDMKAQTGQVLQNAAEVLNAAGMTMGDVVSARVYITDTAMFQDMNAAYRGAFPSSPPARATARAGLTAAPHLVEITLLAVRDANREAVTTPNPDGTPGTPSPVLSSAIHVGRQLFLSGMLGATDASRENAGAQAREALARLGLTLKKAGFSWRDVVDGVVYVPNAGDVPAVMRAWREVFDATMPRPTVVPAALVSPDGLVEIALTAAK